MSIKNPWKTLQSDIRYDNPWIRLRHESVITPSGTEGIYGVVHFKNLAIGVIPLDEDMNTWLVGQYRYPLERYSWEIPEGGCPVGTDALQTARRELKEETGLLATRWREIQRMDLSNSVTDETGIIYIARDLTQGQSAPEPTEELQIKKLPFEETFQMLLRGEITDSLSVAGILKVQYLWSNGLLDQ